jgi:hypothetical protein
LDRYATALAVSSRVVELREALLKARAAAKVAVVEERLRPPDFTELEQAASHVQTSVGCCTLNSTDPPTPRLIG